MCNQCGYPTFPTTSHPCNCFHVLMTLAEKQYSLRTHDTCVMWQLIHNNMNFDLKCVFCWALRSLGSVGDPINCQLKETKWFDWRKVIIRREVSVLTTQREVHTGGAKDDTVFGEDHHLTISSQIKETALWKKHRYAQKNIKCRIVASKIWLPDIAIWNSNDLIGHSKRAY